MDPDLATGFIWQRFFNMYLRSMRVPRTGKPHEHLAQAHDKRPPFSHMWLENEQNISRIPSSGRSW